ncbi:MAG: hypothetical protein LUC89_09820, partial [Oscillospiraceae bacterium]|nr:hypothetical protein [Oscillospiraceae bacterium]
MDITKFKIIAVGKSFFVFSGDTGSLYAVSVCPRMSISCGRLSFLFNIQLVYPIQTIPLKFFSKKVKKSVDKVGKDV